MKFQFKFFTAIAVIITGIGTTIFSVLQMISVDSKYPSANDWYSIFYNSSAQHSLLVVIFLSFAVTGLATAFAFRKQQKRIAIIILVAISTLLVSFILTAQVSSKIIPSPWTIWLIIAACVISIILVSVYLGIAKSFPKKRTNETVMRTLMRKYESGFRITAAILGIIVSGIIIFFEVVSVFAICDSSFAIDNVQSDTWAIAMLIFTVIYCASILTLSILFCEKHPHKSVAITLITLSGIYALLYILELISVNMGMINTASLVFVVIFLILFILVIAFASVHLVKTKMPLNLEAVLSAQNPLTDTSTSVKVLPDFAVEKTNLDGYAAKLTAKLDAYKKLKEDGVLTDQEYKAMVLKELEK